MSSPPSDAELVSLGKRRALECGNARKGFKRGSQPGPYAEILDKIAENESRLPATYPEDQYIPSKPAFELKLMGFCISDIEGDKCVEPLTAVILAGKRKLTQEQESTGFAPSTKIELTTHYPAQRNVIPTDTITTGEPTLKTKHSWIKTKATLLVCNTSILKQWKRRIINYAGKGNLSIVSITCEKEWVSLKYKSVIAADLVLVYFGLLSSISYVSFCTGAPHTKNVPLESDDSNAMSAFLESNVQSLGDFQWVRNIWHLPPVMGNNLPVPNTLGRLRALNTLVKWVIIDEQLIRNSPYYHALIVSFLAMDTSSQTPLITRDLPAEIHNHDEPVCDMFFKRPKITEFYGNGIIDEFTVRILKHSYEDVCQFVENRLFVKALDEEILIDQLKYRKNPPVGCKQPERAKLHVPDHENGSIFAVQPENVLSKLKLGIEYSEKLRPILGNLHEKLPLALKKFYELAQIVQTIFRKAILELAPNSNKTPKISTKRLQKLHKDWGMISIRSGRLHLRKSDCTRCKSPRLVMLRVEHMFGTLGIHVIEFVSPCQQCYSIDSIIDTIFPGVLEEIRLEIGNKYSEARKCWGESFGDLRNNKMPTYVDNSWQLSFTENEGKILQSAIHIFDHNSRTDTKNLCDTITAIIDVMKFSTRYHIPASRDRTKEYFEILPIVRERLANLNDNIAPQLSIRASIGGVSPMCPSCSNPIGAVGYVLECAHLICSECIYPAFNTDISTCALCRIPSKSQVIVNRSSIDFPQDDVEPLFDGNQAFDLDPYADPRLRHKNCELRLLPIRVPLERTHENGVPKPLSDETVSMIFGTRIWAVSEILRQHKGEKVLVVCSQLDDNCANIVKYLRLLCPGIDVGTPGTTTFSIRNHFDMFAGSNYTLKKRLTVLVVTREHLDAMNYGMPLEGVHMVLYFGHPSIKSLAQIKANIKSGGNPDGSVIITEFLTNLGF